MGEPTVMERLIDWLLFRLRLVHVEHLEVLIAENERLRQEVLDLGGVA